jgi:arsenate reductase (thioredoxin)
MAEGLARSILPASYTIQSAGSHPSSVNPFAIEVLNEIGIDISTHKSKSVDTIDPHSVELVVTLCDDEVCPIFPKKVSRLHWSTPDPASSDPVVQENRGLMLTRFRQARDSIAVHIRSELLKSTESDHVVHLDDP